MESSACCRGASDAEQSARSCSATVKCEPVMVKEEPEWGEYGVTEAAAAEHLYAAHEIKVEIEIGPEQIQQQKINFSTQDIPSRAEENACKLKPAGEAAPRTESTRAQSDLTTCEHAHTGQKPHSCYRCHKQFPQQQQLTSHLQITCSSRKPYCCNICNKDFAGKADVTKHMRTHTGEKPFGCNICNKWFKQQAHLTRHIRTHTGEKPFSCDICNKKFANTWHLTEHIRTHKGEKPFNCDKCNRDFAEKTGLTRHMRIHTGEKPFSCDICNKMFTRRSSLTKHKVTHTG